MEFVPDAFVGLGKLLVLLAESTVPLLEYFELVLYIFEIGHALLVDPALLERSIQRFYVFVGAEEVLLAGQQRLLEVGGFREGGQLFLAGSAEFCSQLFYLLLLGSGKRSPFFLLRIELTHQPLQGFDPC